MKNSGLENSAKGTANGIRHRIDTDYAPTRSSLVGRLKAWDDHESWQTFFDTYWKLIYSVAKREGLTDAEAQDAVQETIIAVAKAVKGFEYDRSRGSFRGWLMRWASWRIKDQLRKRGHGVHAAPFVEQEENEGRTSVTDRLPDPEDRFARLWQEEWDGNLREAVMHRVRKKVPPRQYQVFDCYVVKGWPIEQVTQELGVSRASVYIARTRVGLIAKAETSRIENGLL